MGFLNQLFKHREAGEPSPGAQDAAAKTPESPAPKDNPFLHPKDPPARLQAPIIHAPKGIGALARPATAPTQPVLARTMRLELGDVISRVPDYFIRPGRHDLRQVLEFDAKQMAAAMALGRAEVTLAQIARQCPDAFLISAHTAHDVVVRLPLQKLVDQMMAPEPETVTVVRPQVPVPPPIVFPEPEAKTAPTVELPLPVETHTQPVEAHTQPVEAHTQPVEAHTQPVEAHTQPVEAHTQPVEAHTQPVEAHTQPVEARTQPVETHLQPVETAPTSTETAPTSTETAPTFTETAPTSTEMTQTSVELAPTSAELAPTSTGLASTSTGLAPTSTGLAPTSTGLASTSTGLAPTSTGLASTSTGLASTSTGLASTSTGLASTSTETAQLSTETVPVFPQPTPEVAPPAISTALFAPNAPISPVAPPIRTGEGRNSDLVMGPLRVQVKASVDEPLQATLRPVVLGASVPPPEIAPAHAAGTAHVSIPQSGIRPVVVPPPVIRASPAEPTPVFAPPSPPPPLPVAANVAPEPAPVVEKGEFDALQPVFLTDEALDLAAIARHVAALPGITACQLALGERVARQGVFPEGIQADLLQSIAPELAASAGEVASRMNFGAVENVTIHAAGHAVSIFSRGAAVLGVVLGRRGFIPGVRERLAQAVDALVAPQP